MDGVVPNLSIFSFFFRMCARDAPGFNSWAHLLLFNVVEHYRSDIQLMRCELAFHTKRQEVVLASTTFFFEKEMKLKSFMLQRHISLLPNDAFSHKCVMSRYEYVISLVYLAYRRVVYMIFEYTHTLKW